jgi:putative transposase
MADHAKLVICEQSIERTIAWLDQQRRMSKDYERLCASGEALVYAAMIRLMVRRLARS